MLKSRFSALLLTAVLFVGCQPAPGPSPSPSPGGTAPTPGSLTATPTLTTEATPPPAPGSTPYSGPVASSHQPTPEGAAQAFVTAAANRDGESLKHLVAENSEEEFASLRDGTADDRSMAELAQMFQGAAVLGSAKLEEKGQEAEIEVVLQGKKESLELVKTPDGWKIKGF